MKRADDGRRPHRFAQAVRTGLLPVALLAVLWVGRLELRSAEPARWWKGNLHTHSLWSDGDDFPEMIVDWYKSHGYQFLALSDHNLLLEGEKWIMVTNASRADAFLKYYRRFGPAWAELQSRHGVRQARLKTLREFRPLFEQNDQFLLIPSEEITDEVRKTPVHVSATNLRNQIDPQGGTNVLDAMQRNIDAVLAQRERLRRPMFPHLNHPNFGWAVTAEDLMQLRGDRFFEVYNGHPAIHNEGDAQHAGVERMWDIVLTFRLAELGLGTLYGLAVDDSHNYHALVRTNSNPGRGWVVVRAARLRPAELIAALEAGDFYATTGVMLRDLRVTDRELSLEIEPEPDISYVIQFIGTRKGFNAGSEPMELPPETLPPVTRRYSAEIGTVLSEVRGRSATYRLKGDEIYVRAKVISSKPKANGSGPHEVEVAWTQPLAPARK